MDLKGGQASSPDIGKRRIMGKKNTHSFKKFQKELKRKKKAKEKLARRQGKKDQALDDVEEQEHSD
jgi:hypothetical protein